ncbi:uncharacterized protein LOC132608224 [Lycium barbarum]|uniref:uncharacterized protein LOC132608224 n=1 Tax=Lycium barbarum TaxID=112863 RepID=UPI00293E29F0|nr:uncharacterized protein LOC132608224 [Lycium barbarum]
MSGFVLVTLRWYHGGVLDVSSGQPKHKGGQITEFLDIEVDKMSFFELRDYIKELGYTTSCSFCVRRPNSDSVVEIQTDRDILEISQSFENGDNIEIYVYHMVDNLDNVDGPIAFLEYTSPNEESLAAFNEERDGGIQEGDGFAFNKEPAATETAAPAEPVVAETAASEDPLSSEFPILESDQSIDDSSEKRRERIRNDPREIPVGEVGPDLGFDETATPDTSLKGKVAGDEPVYISSDAYSVESYTDDESGSRRARRRIIFDKTVEKVMWELGMVFEDVNEFRDAVTKYALQRGVQLEKFVNEPKKVRVRCRDRCPWLLYASLDKKTNDFMIKTYNPKHRCVKTTGNYMCNAKFLSKHYKNRITEQPNIRIIKFQQLIREELNIHVGKTTARRARAKVGIWNFFNLCFDALKKCFLGGCRKCIGLDGCFLKGITKGQLLAAVAKDANNQMFPIAWAIVEYENKNTWTWFLKLLIADFGMGDGSNYTVISDMQKGLQSAMKELLPLVEHRMCARHILANWAKGWRGLQQRNQFWKCAKNTFE